MQDDANAPTAGTLLRARTEAFISILAATPRLTILSLKMKGSLDNAIIAPFPHLKKLRKMSIANVGDERTEPLYVTAFAYQDRPTLTGIPI
jgi:hypothetical protein